MAQAFTAAEFTKRAIPFKAMVIDRVDLEIELRYGMCRQSAVRHAGLNSAHILLLANCLSLNVFIEFSFLLFLITEHTERGRTERIWIECMPARVAKAQKSIRERKIMGVFWGHGMEGKLVHREGSDTASCWHFELIANLLSASSPARELRY